MALTTMTEKERAAIAAQEREWDMMLARWLVDYESDILPKDARDAHEVRDASILSGWDRRLTAVIVETEQPDEATFAVVRMVNLARFAVKDCYHDEDRFVELARAAYRAVAADAQARAEAREIIPEGS